MGRPLEGKASERLGIFCILQVTLVYTEEFHGAAAVVSTEMGEHTKLIEYAEENFHQMDGIMGGGGPHFKDCIRKNHELCYSCPASGTKGKKRGSTKGNHLLFSKSFHK